MKRFLFLSVLSLAGVVFLAGCGSRSTRAVEDSESATAPQFSAKKGLFLSDKTRQSLGLKLVEVEERKLISTLEVELRIYRKDGASAFASGAIAPEQAKLLKPGQAVELRVPQGGKLTGKVTSVSDQLQGAMGSVEVLVEIPDAADVLLVGTFVLASVPSESRGSVLTVPRSALLGCSEGQFVYTVSGEHLVRTAVKTGLVGTTSTSSQKLLPLNGDDVEGVPTGGASAEFVEITDGLYAGDQVVSQPVMSLWLTELAAVKGGQGCCIELPKGK